MKKNKSTHSVKLDQEEQELRSSYERGEWRTVENLNEDQDKAKKAATHYQRKNTRINIRISPSDLEQIKLKAVNEGLPYQTLIASILHKYAAGRLK